MLFTDADCVTLADLKSLDSEVARIAQSENLTVEGDGSIIRRSIEEMGQDLKSKLQSFTGYVVGIGSSANHIAAVMNIASGSVSRPILRLNQVVVGEPDPAKTEFKRWAEYSALADFYRTVVLRKVNDKHEHKMDLYRDMADRAWSILSACGIPLVMIPLPAPGAIREYNSGSWGVANLSAGGSGSTDSGAIYDVVVTWTGAAYVSPSVRSNSESCPSAIASVTTTAGQIVSVNIASLNPPSGTFPSALGTADGIHSPMLAAGWNIYVGLTGQTLYLQNSSPIPIATKTHALSNTPVLSGAQPGAGQASDFNFAVQSILQRA